MAPRATLDLLVIGADAAGLAAAACAAKSGSSVIVVPTGAETPAEGVVPEPPNFVWRLLDLHEHELRFVDWTSVASYLADGAPPLATTEDAAETGRRLAAREPALEHLWRGFVEEMRVADDGAAAGLHPGRYLSANEALDDYFDDEALKAHLVGAYLAPMGLAGDEAGSAALLGAAGARGVRRLDAAALGDALRAIAAALDVEIADSKLARLGRDGGKFWKAATENGREVKARQAMASSSLLAEAAGWMIAAAGGPMLRRSGVEATIRIRFDRKPKLAVAPLNIAASDRGAIIRARNAALEGRLDEEPPLLFEIRGKDIIARAPYCPSRFRENGEARDWTGQDRQVLGRQAAAFLQRRLGPALGEVRDIDVTIGPDVSNGLRLRDFSLPPIPAPAPAVDAVGAAARLALEIVGHG